MGTIRCWPHWLLQEGRTHDLLGPEIFTEIFLSLSWEMKPRLSFGRRAIVLQNSWTAASCSCLPWKGVLWEEEEAGRVHKAAASERLCERRCLVDVSTWGSRCFALASPRLGGQHIPCWARQSELCFSHLLPRNFLLHIICRLSFLFAFFKENLKLCFLNVHTSFITHV